MNIDRVMENLRRKGDEAVTAAKTALREGVNNIVNDAKSRCPVKTGKLRDSIHAESLEDGAIYKITTDAFLKSCVAGRGYQSSAGIKNEFFQ